MKCLKCGSLNSDAAVYCKNCAAYLAEKPVIEHLDLFKALVLSMLGSGVFYLVFPMPVVRNEHLIQLFSGRISEIIFTLTLWSLFLILFKFIRHRQQQRAYSAFRDHSLHESFSRGIYVKDVEERVLEISQFLESRRVRKFQNSVIFRRVRRILHYLKAVPKKEEINTILNYQADIDHNRMQTSYTLLNVFIWAIPILGFIGTVFGIGQSIGEFSLFIRGVDTTDLSSQMRSALGGVTQGLSVAFNTTFLALVGVIPVMVFSSTLRKGEEDLLLSIEEYCLEDLLPNLHVRPGEEAVEEAVQEHLLKLTEFSENWRHQVHPVMDLVKRHTESLNHQVLGLQPLLQRFSETFFQLKDSLLAKDSAPANAHVDSNPSGELLGEAADNSSQATVSGTPRTGPGKTDLPDSSNSDFIDPGPPAGEAFSVASDQTKSEKPVSRNTPQAHVETAEPVSSIPRNNEQ